MVSSDLVGVGAGRVASVEKWVGDHLRGAGAQPSVVCLAQAWAGHCLLRICQETHHIVAAGLSLHSARHLFAAGDPWWRGSSGPVRPQSRRLAASGYRMAYRV